MEELSIIDDLTGVYNRNYLKYRIEEKKKKLIFDLEIPYSYKKKDCDRVIGQIGALMKEMDEKYECVVNIDKKYVAGE